MTNYTDINTYLDKATESLKTARMLVASMEFPAHGDRGKQDVLIGQIMSMESIIDVCKELSDKLTDIYESSLKN